MLMPRFLPWHFVLEVRVESRKLVQKKLLRYGYTTGSCAAAAAKAATYMLLAGETVSSINLKTANGTVLHLDIIDASFDSETSKCAVKKDSGDDPDVTNGMLIYAQATKIDEGIVIDGGEGVGRVTKPGLDQPVGAAAINSIPRRMITEAVQQICLSQGYRGGISIIISIPEGEKIAKHTFNSNMGIEGGLSVIGTTGIVEPMSNKALMDVIRLELKQLKITGANSVLLTPGNYGKRFICDQLKILPSECIVCSNFIGETINAAVEMGFAHILLVGHVGKLVKLGIGITNTHSSYGDGRMETLAACALEAGGDISLLKGILACVTTDAAIQLIAHAGLLQETMAVLGDRVTACLNRYMPEGVVVGYVMFINTGDYAGVLCESSNAKELMDIWRKN